MESLVSRMNDSEEIQVVIFRLGNETFGVDVHQVREIIKVRDCTRIPNAPSYIKGIINLRGQITVILDLHEVFGVNGIHDKMDADARIIIVDSKDANVGILVDAVLGVTRLPRKNVEPPPLLSKSRALEFIEGVAKQEDNLIIILNLEKLLENIKSEVTAHEIAS